MDEYKTRSSCIHDQTFRHSRLLSSSGVIWYLMLQFCFVYTRGRRLSSADKDAIYAEVLKRWLVNAIYVPIYLLEWVKRHYKNMSESIHYTIGSLLLRMFLYWVGYFHFINIFHFNKILKENTYTLKRVLHILYSIYIERLKRLYNHFLF